MIKKNIDKTKVIRVFETFAGIGAQHKAIKNINLNYRVIGTSEWDVRAIIAYAQIHHKAKFEQEIKKVQKWSDEQIAKYIFKRTFSLNSKTPSNLKGKKRNFKENLIAANIVNNNFPDINQIIAENIKGINLLTYSFPCQGLSIANMGRGKGINPTSESTSNLIWQIKTLLDDANSKSIKLPKYLLMENVTSLIGKNHLKDYQAWKKYLESIGYKTMTVVLNGVDHGSLQQRKRVFGISVKTNKDIMTDTAAKNIINKIGTRLSDTQKKNKYVKLLSISSKEELKLATPNNTPSRVKMANENIDLIKDAEKRKYIFNTLTTKQDRQPNIGMIDVEKFPGKLNKRFITPREGYMMMGFQSADFNRVNKKFKEGILTKESLYRQAGNSIVVNVLESIFKFIWRLDGGVYD